MRKVQLAETLDDLHQTGSRQEGQILTPVVWRHKTAHRQTASNSFLSTQPPEKTKTKCNCGWEDRIGKGKQEGFIGVLIAGYGFITKEYVRGRNATGVYFHKSQLINYPFTKLKIGGKVHFVVDQNDEGCIAKQINVVEKPSLPTGPQQVF